MFRSRLLPLQLALLFPLEDDRSGIARIGANEKSWEG